MYGVRRRSKRRLSGELAPQAAGWGGVLGGGAQRRSAIHPNCALGAAAPPATRPPREPRLPRRLFLSLHSLRLFFRLG